MKIALMSDIHGNAVALEAVRHDLQRARPDLVVCLGDAVQGGPQPAEVVAVLRDLGCPVVLGNADDFLLDADAGREPATPHQLAVREWTRAQLGDVGLDFLRSFRPTIEIELGGDGTLLCFHGSPASYDDLIFPTTEEEELRRLLGVNPPRLLAGGHVHLQFQRRLGPSLFVNPGSVGLAYDHAQPDDDARLDPWSEYALVTVTGGTQEIAFRRVPLDTDAVIGAILSSGMPDAAASARQWEPR